MFVLFLRGSRADFKARAILVLRLRPANLLKGATLTLVYTYRCSHHVIGMPVVWIPLKDDRCRALWKVWHIQKHCVRFLGTLSLTYIIHFVFQLLELGNYLVLDLFARIFQVVEYETMRKDVSRSAYTRRILEIVGNIKKQKEEINKVVLLIFTGF